MVRASMRAGCVVLAAMGTLAAGLGIAAANANGSGAVGKLAGRWAGGGTMVPTYGRNEQFRCIITYAVGEDAARIRQHMRCQGDETSFDAVTRLDISGDRVTGVWVENNYSINGTVRGTLTPKGFDIRLLGTFFQARMTVVANACEQSVKVVPEGSGNMKEMAATLIKSDRASICDPSRVIVPPVPVPAVRPAHLARVQSQE
jgi:hypothetical protein